MLLRLLTALVGISLAVVLVFSHNPLPFAIAMGIISVIAAHEFYNGAKKTGARPIEWAGILAVALFVASAFLRNKEEFYLPFSSIFPAVLTLLLILSFCAEFIRKERAPIINIGTTVFGALYVGWLISHIVVLRRTPTTSVGSYDLGSWLVMLTFLCTWACDTAAFVVGSYWGKNKLAPMLSPNKTYEGAVGGFLGSILLAVIVGFFVMKLPIGHTIALGALIGVLSQIGDLSESAIKRELGIKDFGNMVPGHGGMLDRFDSLLFTAPAVYYYLIIFIKHWPN